MLVPRPRTTPLPDYNEERCTLIAEAIAEGFDVSRVIEHRREFQDAAHWFEVRSISPKPAAPSAGRKKLDQIAKAARKLLTHLGVDDPANASDGPGTESIFEVLASVEGQSEASISRATERIGKLVEILEAVDAAKDIECVAEQTSQDVKELGDLTVPKEHQGDVAVNEWVAHMFAVYREPTGKEPATSVGGPDRANAGEASGPLVRFLEATGEPIGISYGTDAWRKRVRTILKAKA